MYIYVCGTVSHGEHLSCRYKSSPLHEKRGISNSYDNGRILPPKESGESNSSDEGTLCVCVRGVHCKGRVTHIICGVNHR